MNKHADWKNYDAALLSKYGVRISEMEKLQKAIDDGKYRVTVTHEMYHKTPSGKWQQKPYMTETTQIGAESYMNIISSIPMFKDKVKKEYTQYGYIPTELANVSWGTGNTKSRRVFVFEAIKESD